MPGSGKSHSRYMPGLDGLRALALIGVMAYHWGFGFASGGFLGVSLFFVLSGYLITDILTSQWHHHRRIDLKDFWVRRFRRLLPAIMLMLILIVAWVTLFDRERLPNLRGDVLGAITYISNWQFIFQQQSYFESFGLPSPLGHFWSLAVEEQFYLLWPLIMLAGLKLFPKRGQLFTFIAAGALLSAAVMGVLYQPGTDPSRVYYGTDTRAFGLLIGAGLAIVWPSWRLSASAAPGVKRSLNLIGMLALLVVLLMMWKADRYDPFLYRGGMFLFSIAAAVLVAVLAHPAAGLSRLFSGKPLLWLGVRSYGIYLWHYPVLILFSPPSGVSGLSLPQIILQVAASIVLAALSWKYVEQPIRRGGFRKLKERLSSLRKRPASISVKGWIVSFSSLILIGIFCTGMMSSVSDARTAGDIAAMLNIPGPDLDQPGAGPNGAGAPEGATAQPPADNPSAEPAAREEPADPSAVPEGAGQTDGKQTPEPTAPDKSVNPEGKAQDSDNGPGPEDPSGTGSEDPSGVRDQGDDTPPSAGKDASVSEGSETSGKPSDTGTPPSGNTAKDTSGSAHAGQGQPSGSDSGNSGKPEEPARPDPGTQPQKPVSGAAVSAIGDSVMLGVTPYLEKAIPGIHVDAVIGRQMRQARDLVPGLQANNRIQGGTVIIGLGTNGAFAQKDLDRLLQSLEPAQRVLLVNTRVPRDWEQNVNEMLAAAAGRYPNVKLIDWYSASKGHPEYFRSDGVHLEPEGAAAYTSMLLEALK
ncbi:acyltransferase family protein [Paenibacillus ihbetae]|uniref:Acyltransferase n=1 Tax=Paenibacillus ihbetae TaxID=1870820 RepID=A0ABX3K0U0_9BACL|nr:acyltransferase family protein [Paenibacillus ihbetae]OOC63035.1 acyltransferase [Paenibacillus ihbetae]